MPLVTAVDVAGHLLTRRPGPMATVKLHRLVYLCQARALAGLDSPLFVEPVLAWLGGPRVRSVHAHAQGRTWDAREHFDAAAQAVHATASGVIDSVDADFGDLSIGLLSVIGMSDRAWRAARQAAGGLPMPDLEITPDSIREYYRATFDQATIVRRGHGEVDSARPLLLSMMSTQDAA